MADKLLLTVEAVMGILSPDEAEFWADLPQKKRDIISHIVVKSVKAQLAKAEPIIRKDERERIREDILGGKPKGLTNSKGEMVFPAKYNIPANSFIYFVSQDGLQALKEGEL